MIALLYVSVTENLKKNLFWDFNLGTCMVLSCTRGKITLIQYTVRYCPRQQNLYYCSYFKKTKKIHLKKTPTKLIKTIFYRWIQTTRIHCTCACASTVLVTVAVFTNKINFVNSPSGALRKWIDTAKLFWSCHTVFKHVSYEGENVHFPLFFILQ